VPQSWVTQPDYDQNPAFAEDSLRREEKFRGYARSLLRSIRQCVPQGRLLDIGCAAGTLVDEANRAGYEAEGIDLDSNAITVARGRGRPVHRCSLSEWNRTGYDAVVLAHTLEHVSDPVGFATAAAVRLRPGGCLVVSLPCYRGLHPRLFGRRWYGWVPTQHYTHFAPRTLNAVFSRIGLDTVLMRQESMDHRPMWGCFQRRLIPLALFGWGVAIVGGRLGLGDQLVGIGRKRIGGVH